MNKKIFKNKSQKGFTLIEMIVSLGLFIVVALIAVGALLKVMDANKKSLNLKTAINNLNFAMESMSREMRVGSNYHLDLNDTGSVAHELGTVDVVEKLADNKGWTLYFYSSKSCNFSNQSTMHPNAVYAYRYTRAGGYGKLQKAQEDIAGSGICDGIQDSDFQDLTAPGLDITQTAISVNNEKQPYVSFWFDGTTGVRVKDQTRFTLQTMVSQRIK